MEVTGELRLKAWWLALGWMMVSGLLVLTLMPHPPQPLTFDFADKIEHLAGFAWLSLWFQQIVVQRRKKWAALGLVLLGVFIEVAQSFTATRSFEYADMVADGVGVLLGAWLARGKLGRMLLFVENWLLREAKAK